VSLQSGLGSLSIITTIQYNAHDFLFLFHCKAMTMSGIVSEIKWYISWKSRFFHTHFYITTPWGKRLRLALCFHNQVRSLPYRVVLIDSLLKRVTNKQTGKRSQYSQHRYFIIHYLPSLARKCELFPTYYRQPDRQIRSGDPRRGLSKSNM